MKAQSHRFLIEISLKKLIKFIQIHSQIDILYELNFGFILLIKSFQEPCTDKLALYCHFMVM